MDVSGRRFAGLAGQVYDRHTQAVARVPAYRALRMPKRTVRPVAVGNGQVLPVHFACRDGCNQRVHRNSVARHHHQAAGVFVQPVHDTRARHVHQGTVQGQQTIEQRAAPITRRRMHHQAHGLVDNQYIGIAVDHIERHGLRFESSALGRRLQADLHPVVAAHRGRLFAGNAVVEGHVPGLNQLLQIAA